MSSEESMPVTQPVTGVLTYVWVCFGCGLEIGHSKDCIYCREIALRYCKKLVKSPPEWAD